MGHRAARVAGLLTVAAVAGAVVLFSQTFATCFPAPKLAALSVGLPLALAALAASGRLGVPLASPIAPPLAAVAFAAGLGWLRSPAPEAGTLFALPVAAAVALVWLAAALGAERGPRERLLAGLCAAHLVCAGYGLLQITGRDPWSWSLDYGRGRIFASLGNPNFLAGQFALMLPVCAALGTAERLPLRWLARAAFAAGLVAFTAAQTRSGWLGLGAGVAAAMAGWWACHGRSVPPRTRWLLPVVAVILLPYCLPALNPTGVALPRQIGSSFEVDQQSARQRFFWWTAAGYLLRARPVEGHGLGGFSREFPARQRLAAARYADLPPAFCNHPHQDYLYVATEHGLVGLGLLLWLGAVWLRLGWTGLRRGNAQAAGSFAGVIALAVHALFNMPSLIEATLAAAAVLCGLDAARARPVAVAPAPAGGRTRMLLVPALALGVALFLAIRPATLLVAQAYLNGGRILVEQNAYGPGAFLVRQTLRLTDAPWRTQFMLGTALYAQGYWQEARQAFRADEQENPWGADAILHAAKTLRQEGRHAAADAEARRALRVVPNYADAAITLASVAYADAEQARGAGRAAESRAALERARMWTNYALGFFPRHAEAWKLAGFVAIREARWRDARDAWRHSLAARPGDDKLRNSLDGLEADLPRLLRGGRLKDAPR